MEQESRGTEGRPWPQETEERALEQAFSTTVPEHHANLFYVTTTSVDVRIALGNVRPTRAGPDARYDVNRFDVAVYLPPETARQLITALDGFLKTLGK